jgi:hypothetical protein
MDAELHHVPHVVGEIQEMLLSVRTTGVDVLRHDIRSLSDLQ